MLIAISCLVLSLICFSSSLWKWRKPRNPNAYRQLTAQVISSGVQNIETKEKNVYEQYGIYTIRFSCEGRSYQKEQSFIMPKDSHEELPVTGSLLTVWFCPQTEDISFIAVDDKGTAKGLGGLGGLLLILAGISYAVAQAVENTSLWEGMLGPLASIALACLLLYTAGKLLKKWHLFHIRHKKGHYQCIPAVCTGYIYRRSGKYSAYSPIFEYEKDGAEHTVKEISFYARKPYKIGDRVTLYWDSEAQMAKEAEKAPVGLIFILLFFAAVFFIRCDSTHARQKR